MVDLVPLAGIAPTEVDALLDRAFGPGRHARTAYRVRAGTVAIPALSLAAIQDGALIGSIQCWPVMLQLDAGGDAAMVMVGPVAVDPARQNQGIGRALIARALAAAADTGDDAAMWLIGDPEYYNLFGFTAERTARWRLPGPVERHRLLARGTAVPDAPGLLAPRACDWRAAG